MFIFARTHGAEHLNAESGVVQEAGRPTGSYGLSDQVAWEGDKMTSDARWLILAVGILVGVLASLLAATVAATLAYVDGATLPAAATRAGVAFAGSMGLFTGLLALVVATQG
jgi:hypothetical protein